MFQPVIKWSGSKRSQCQEILKHFPSTFDTYYEPFVGGGSMFRCLIDHKSDFNFKRIVCSDLNRDLINLWNCVKNNPKELSEHYTQLWNALNRNPDKSYQRDYFNKIRERLNQQHNPMDFMFIMRTTTNGMPRYNSNGEFNNSFHITRNGINPVTLNKIICEWSKLLNENDVTFKVADFKTVIPKTDDFIYLDPPYANTKGMYFGNFDTQSLYDWLALLKCPYVMSYDGISGDVDNTAVVPSSLYDEHLYIESGNSSFKRTIGKSNDSIVFESLYIKKS